MLTAKQEKFAQCIADGMNQADAYRAAYDAANSKPETVQKRASELMQNGEVAGRVRELQERMASLALWSREDSVRELAKIAKGEDAEAKPSDKVNAIKALNTMHGYDAPTELHVTSKELPASVDDFV